MYLAEISIPLKHLFVSTPFIQLQNTIKDYLKQRKVVAPFPFCSYWHHKVGPLSYKLIKRLEQSGLYYAIHSHRPCHPLPDRSKHHRVPFRLGGMVRYDLCVND